MLTLLIIMVLDPQIIISTLTVFAGITTTEIVGTTAQLSGETLGIGNDSGTISFNNKELSSKTEMRVILKSP